ncbi:ubiquitin-conjugating enzyme/RWD-like protein [Umbelopsis sp. PMI_123]|nr:ubiquitin-conjugating enzyme/RWD-like protein [Umbelopsis sp. PMI_123]
MTDYAEEQQNELEALQSIYPDEFEDLGDEGFRIVCRPEDQDEEAPSVLALKVKYTPNYPDELPEFQVESIEGELTPEQRERIMNTLTASAEESIGMAMIFTMASMLQEELYSVISEGKQARIEAELAKARLAEEAENRKFKGTPVTVELFLTWKAKFDKEIAEKEQEAKGKIKTDGKPKLTGRQLFEQDKTLASSDASYMEEGDVTVDVTQFEKEERVQDDEEEDDNNQVWRNLGED